MPSSMKAAVLHELRKPLVIEQVPIPELGYGEVLVQTKACGICGTDLHIIEGTGYKPRLPHILGHEPAGVVAKVGDGVSKLREGDRVLPNIFFNVRRMFLLQDESEDFVREFQRSSRRWNQRRLRWSIKAPAKNLFLLPENIKFPEGSVISESVVTSVHAIRRRAQLKAGDTVLIIGAGGIGQTMIQIAKNAGARVIAVTRRVVRLQIAEKMAADELINSSENDVVKEVKRLTNGIGVDIVIDNVGSSETLLQGLGSVRPGGRVITVGEHHTPLHVQIMC